MSRALKNIQREFESLSFAQLRDRISIQSDFEQEKHYPRLAMIGELFSLPNLPPILLTKWVINTKVSQKIFQGSIRLAAILLLFPLWFLLVFFIAAFWGGLKVAVIVVLVQVVSLLVRRELVRFNH